MADPMLTNIEDAIYDLISGMRKGPYNYDWSGTGSVNQPDQAKQRFPSAEVMLISEVNVDDEDGAWSNGYYNEANYDIIVRASLDEQKEIPLYEINKALNQALDDLKKLFGTSTNYSLAGTCDTIMYKGMERIRDSSGDVFRPVYMVTHWLVRYESLRNDPTSLGG